jgi:hypothetical protein
MSAADTIESLAEEFGRIAGRSAADNEAAVFNIACWLRSAIKATRITFTPIDTRMLVTMDGDRWTWSAAWPHERLRAFIERQRAVLS